MITQSRRATAAVVKNGARQTTPSGRLAGKLPGLDDTLRRADEKLVGTRVEKRGVALHHGERQLRQLHPTMVVLRRAFGATAGACAKALKRAGAARVDVLSFARVVPGHE